MNFVFISLLILLVYNFLFLNSYINFFNHTIIFIYYCYCYCFFSSGVNYAEFENYNEVEVEDEVTNSEEYS